MSKPLRMLFEGVWRLLAILELVFEAGQSSALIVAVWARTMIFGV